MPAATPRTEGLPPTAAAMGRLGWRHFLALLFLWSYYRHTRDGVRNVPVARLLSTSFDTWNQYWEKQVLSILPFLSLSYAPKLLCGSQYHMRFGSIIIDARVSVVSSILYDLPGTFTKSRCL